MRKFLLRSAIVLAVLAALGGIALLIERHSAKAAWERYAAAAKARGVKLSLKDEMLQPPIPAAENFAAVPIFAQLYESDAVGGTKGMSFKLPYLKRQPSNSAPPYLEAWRSLFVEEKWLAADAPDATPAAILRVLDEQFGPEWQQIREAAARPMARFPEMVWGKSFSAAMPHLTILNRATRICDLRMDAHIAQGDGPAAYEDVHLLLRFCSAVENDASLVCFVLRSGMMHLAIDRVRKGITTGVWDDTTLLRLDADLAKIRFLAGYRWALQSERGMQNDLYGSMQTGDRKSLDTMIADLTDGGGSRWLPASLPRSWLHRNQVRSNQYYDELLARFDDSKERYISTVPGVSSISQTPNRAERFKYALFYLLVPAFEVMESTALKAHTRVQCARIAVALERWRLAQGAYPEALAALVPGLLPAVPHDVIDAQPLRYRRTEEGGYLLYSIGIDAKDDGGIGAKPRQSDKDAPDWVWKP